MFRSFFFDPLAVAAKLRALPHFYGNWITYARRNHDGRFSVRWWELQYTSADRYRTAGGVRGHYFHQDLWAASRLYQCGVREHVDVASRLDGFVAHLLPFCKVTYVDLRPLGGSVPNLTYRKGSLDELPFADGAVPSLSSLHVLEHVGLGRYGDRVDPQGYQIAAAELSRVLAPGGTLLLGTPVGRERLCFDAHRIFDPETVVQAFGSLRLESFALIDDEGAQVRDDATFADARMCTYGCGLFAFAKPSGTMTATTLERGRQH